MFRAYGPGPSLWETVLPPEALVMPAELSMVDALLDDPVCLEPFRPYFHPTAGRKSVPGAHSSDCEQRFRFKANAVPVETEQMPVGSTCGRCSVVKWPSWRPGHLTGYDIFARLFL